MIDWRRVIAVTVVASVLLLVPPLFASSFLLHVLTISLYYVILAASWNLLAGFTGQFSLAHHAFAAVGAYTSGLLIYHLKAPLWLSMPAGVVLAGALGYGLGRMVLRMRAIYLAIATWAFAETIHILLTAAYGFTRGELGLSVPALYRNVEPRAYYFTFAGLTVACLLGMYLLVRSPLGYFMRAIKDDELRAESLGIDTTQVKVWVFALTSAIAGLAGVFYGHYLVLLSPQMVDFSEMAKLIIMVVVGGLGSFLGPVIGTVPVQIVITYLQKYGEWSFVIFALLVIVLMRLHQGGVASLLRLAWSRVSAGAGSR